MDADVIFVEHKSFVRINKTIIQIGISEGEWFTTGFNLPFKYFPNVAFTEG